MSTKTNQSIWLAEPGDGFNIAFAGSSIEEFAMNVKRRSVPISYDYCCQLVYRHGELVPVVDLSTSNTQTNQRFYAVLFLHAGKSSEHKTIGLHLIEPPRKVILNDKDFSRFDPEQCGHWKNAALSGYFHEGKHIPLIDPQSMRSDFFIDELNQTAMIA